MRKELGKLISIKEENIRGYGKVINLEYLKNGRTYFKMTTPKLLKKMFGDTDIYSLIGMDIVEKYKRVINY